MNLSVHDARVVFFGDSILDWGSRNGNWFNHSGWLNRGIGGQTTAQLLQREPQDVLALHPKAVLLEGGNNDMRLGSAPSDIRNNILRMGEVAEAEHIKVFVATMTPVCDCFKPIAGLRTPEKIGELNKLLSQLCKQKHWQLVDLNHPLAGADGYMRAEFTVDGVHPNDAGYRQIAPVIEQAFRHYR